LAAAGWVAAALLLTAGCGQSRCAEIRALYGLESNDTCGPSEVQVKRVVDGDTVELEDGTMVRYIGVNTPEKNEPYYQEAKDYNQQAVEGREVELVYDQQCKDYYRRLLAYVCVDGEMVNEELLRTCLAKTLPIKPNTAHADHFKALWEEAGKSCRMVCANASTCK